MTMRVSAQPSIPQRPVAARTAPVAATVAMPTDRYTSSKPAQAQGDGAFKWGTAAKFFGKGLLHPVTSLFAGFKASPLKTSLTLLGGAAALGALTVGLPLVLPMIGFGALAPFAAPVVSVCLAAGFAGYGARQLLVGGRTAHARYQRGDYDGAERAFETLGRGSFNVVSSLISGVQAVKAFRATVQAQLVGAGRPS